MSKERKTVRVEDLRVKYNGLLANPEITRNEKMLVSCLIEDLLMDANRYRGFTFLEGAVDPGHEHYYTRKYF